MAFATEAGISADQTLGLVDRRVALDDQVLGVGLLLPVGLTSA